MEPLLTVEDAARRLNTSEASVRRWLRNGELTGIQVGGEWRIERADLEAYIQRNRRSAKHEERSE